MFNTSSPTPSVRRKRAITAGAWLCDFYADIVFLPADWMHRWVTLGTGLMYRCFYCLFRSADSPEPVLLLAAWAVIMSLFAAWLPVSETFQTAILTGRCSLGWLAGGTYALISYLRKHPIG